MSELEATTDLVSQTLAYYRQSVTEKRNCFDARLSAALLRDALSFYRAAVWMKPRGDANGD